MTRKRRHRAGPPTSASAPPRAREIVTRAAPEGNAGVAALWIGIAALLLARAGLYFVPSMWVWSLNLQRYVHPVVAWG